MKPHQNFEWDNFSDTWTAADGLGRELPDYGQVGGPREDKFVGMFYFLWLGQHGTEGPFDVSKILKEHPDAMQNPDNPAWGPLGKYHHWGEPQSGYYLSDDAYVIRKHAQMLADAGVDTLIFDVTNGFTYKECYMTLLKVFTEVRRDGGKTPQVAFLTPFWDPSKVVQKLYDDLYGPGLYQDLWFDWKGKPLILADPDKVEPEQRSFFTFRKPEPSYFVGPSGPDQWGWLEVYPQHAFYNSEGKTEQVTVGVAQNAVDGRLGCLSEPGAMGRSYHGGRQPEGPYPTDQGLNFAEQWERALELDPEFIFITSWNEWIAMRFKEFNGVQLPVMFVDQFDQEFSRDIEPMAGGHADHYYYQLISYIRKYKGVRKPATPTPPKTIAIDGDFTQWDDVGPEYRDDIGDTMHRNHPGWGAAGMYVNTTGKNDFVQLKVARDSKHLYFYARIRNPITPYTDRNWMMLFLKINKSGVPSWEGYQFVVNRKVLDRSTTVLERSEGDWNWTEVSKLVYKVEGNELHLAVPRDAIGLGDCDEPVELEFKWADHMQSDGDIQEFTVSGDSAPNGRFNYFYSEKALKG
jgi:hypothetical protein